MSRPLPPLAELVNLFEVEEAARLKLAPEIYGRVAAGSGAGLTLRRNREAFDRMTLHPRMLVDVREMDISTELFGDRMEAPLLIAPTADHRALHPEGEIATARGARAAGTVMVVSARPSLPFEKIAAESGAALWLQVDGSEGSEQQVKRALAAGCRAVCLTPGAPYDLPSEPLHRARRSPRPAVPGWEALERLCAVSTRPVLVKGVLRPDDARTAVEKGAQGIIVSNHGGRLADGAPSAIEALPAVVEAVGSRVPVLVDSGFRRGTDVLKALALGARAVLLGRPPLWGLAAYGSDGVRAVCEMMQTELALAMGLSGKPNLAAVDRSLVRLHRW